MPTTDRHTTDRPTYGDSLQQDAVVITLPTDSFECPDCGVIVVATDDRVIDLASGHECACAAPSTAADPPSGGPAGGRP